MKAQKNRNAALVEEIRRLQEAMEQARARLDGSRDPRLLEAGAYELKYLEARQSWLFALARESACTGAVRCR